jgi:hypothetical protein
MPDQYGAAADGVTDDTVAIQNAVNAAKNAGGGVISLSPSGTYVFTRIILYPGITMELNGATCKRPANQPNSTRMFTSGDPAGGFPTYSGAQDSRPIRIRNGILDGNRANQGAYQNYEQEQSHLIFMYADATQPGRLRVDLHNLVLRDVVADGIALSTNVDAQISDIRAWDCFRGGVNVLGGHSVVEMTNIRTGGNVHATGIDIEVDQIGYGGSLAADITMDNVVLDGDLEVGMHLGPSHAAHPGGTFTATNVQCRRAGWAIGGYNSRVRLSNSVLTVGSPQESDVTWPQDTVLDNVTFVLNPNTPSPNTPLTLGVRVRMKAGSHAANQQLVLRNCTWRAGPDVKASDTLIGLEYHEDVLSQNNEVVIDGGYIPPRFNVGLDMKYGGRAVVTGLRNHAALPIRWAGNEGGSGIDLTIRGMDVRGAPFYMVGGDAYGNNKRIEQSNVFLDETSAGYSFAVAHLANFVGGRTIEVASSPVGRLPGMRGDVAILRDPVAGQVWRWVCTFSAPDASAVWKAEAALAA